MCRLKQLFCRHKKLDVEKYTDDIDGQPYIVEKVERCIKCGKVKHFELYGKTYVVNWKITEGNNKTLP